MNFLLLGLLLGLEVVERPHREEVEDLDAAEQAEADAESDGAADVG